MRTIVNYAVSHARLTIAILIFLLGAGAPPTYAQEARRALAIHHEHRVHDLGEARRLAERALAAEADPAEADALRHRLARLDRKLRRG